MEWRTGEQSPQLLFGHLNQCWIIVRVTSHSGKLQSSPWHIATWMRVLFIFGQCGTEQEIPRLLIGSIWTKGMKRKCIKISYMIKFGAFLDMKHNDQLSLNSFGLAICGSTRKRHKLIRRCVLIVRKVVVITWVIWRACRKGAFSPSLATTETFRNRRGKFRSGWARSWKMRNFGTNNRRRLFWIE